MKTNYYLRCKKCKGGTVVYHPDKEALKLERRRFEEEHKECKK